jgi:hypothetical protein
MKNHFLIIAFVLSGTGITAQNYNYNYNFNNQEANNPPKTKSDTFPRITITDPSNPNRLSLSQIHITGSMVNTSLQPLLKSKTAIMIITESFQNHFHMNDMPKTTKGTVILLIYADN